MKKSKFSKLPWFDRRLPDDDKDELPPPPIDDKEAPPPYEETEQPNAASSSSNGISLGPPSGDRRTIIAADSKGGEPSIETETKTETAIRFKDCGTVTGTYNVTDVVRIEGKTHFRGTVTTNQFVWIDRGAQIDGEIRGGCISVSGKGVRVGSPLLATRQIWVEDDVEVNGDIEAGSNATFSDTCVVTGRIKGEGNLVVRGKACLAGDVEVKGDVTLSDQARITGRLKMGGKLKVLGEEAFVAEHWHECEGNGKQPCTGSGVKVCGHGSSTDEEALLDARGGIKADLIVRGETCLAGEVVVKGHVVVKDKGRITGKLKVGGMLMIVGEEAFVAEHEHDSVGEGEGEAACVAKVLISTCSKGKKTKG